MNIKEELFALQDREYGDFQSKLIPTLPRELVIGVRTPALRELAKRLRGTQEAETFLKELPHRYFEENNLHAFILSGMKDLEACMQGVEDFLPYVDNWATCDQMRPAVFKKHRDELLEHIRLWLRSDLTYTVRFGMGMLMCHFLDEDFKEEYPELVSAIHSEEYYVNMMEAWYFATALAKQYDAVLPYIEEGRLSPWVHNKTIQKAVESYRISGERKAHLKTLKGKQHG